MNSNNAIAILLQERERTENKELIQAIDTVMKLVENRQSQYVSEINIFDTEEIYDDCTVQVWSNSKTGSVSVGWWKNR